VSARDDEERLWPRLRRVFRLPPTRTRLEAEIDEELRFHLEGRIEEFMRTDGLTRPEAERKASALFGDLAGYRRDTRDIDFAMNERRQHMDARDALARETRLAARALKRSPAFTFVTILTLGLGLGAATAIFTLLDAVVLRPLPYRDADRLVQLSSPVPRLKGQTRWGLARHEMFYFLDNGHTLEALGVYQVSDVSVMGSGAERTERARWVQASSSLMNVLGFVPERGRLILPDDNHSQVPTVVVLSHGYWQRRFGGDTSIVGTSISIEGFPLTVVGVLPRGADLPDVKVDLWAPAHVDSTTTWNNHSWSAIGRLRPGVSAQDAVRDLAPLTERLPEVYPQVYGPNWNRSTGFRTDVVPLQEAVVGELVTRSLWTLFGAVALVLLIAAANVGNLFLVRVDSRRREMAVRTALGADRAHLAVHYFAEAFLLAAGAAAVAIGVAAAMVRLMVATAPSQLPRLSEVRLDGMSVAFAIGGALVAGIVFGIAPLWGARPEMATLRQAARGQTNSRQRMTVRRVLVASQMALAVILLAAAGLLLQTFRNLRTVRLGFEPRGVLTVGVALPNITYGRDAVRASTILEQLADRVRSQAGVTAVGFGDRLPLSSGDWCNAVTLESPSAPGGVGACPPTSLVSPGYFEAMGIRVEGRSLDWAGMNAGDGAMIVSHAFARHHWPNESAIGKGIRFSRGPIYYRVVGIADDVTGSSVDGQPLELVYFPMRPLAGSPLWGAPVQSTLVVRTTTDNPLGLLPAISAALAEIEPRAALSNAATMSTIVARSMARHSFTMLLLLIAAVVAVGLSAVGIYGVIAYVAEQRRGEIGIRMALGARASQIKAMVVRESMILCAAGVAIGLLGAFATTRALTVLLYGVRAADPPTFVAVAVVLLAVSAAASYLPARRAAATDPADALRAD
jgi:predicted permease